MGSRPRAGSSDRWLCSSTSLQPACQVRDLVNGDQELAALASRALATTGQSDLVWGHVAIRDSAGRGIWIKAPGWGLAEATAERVQLVSFDAEVIVGTGAPHKECYIHIEVLRAQPSWQCSVHTHAPAAIAFASLGVPLLPISHDGALFGGDDVPRHPGGGRLVADRRSGEVLARALGTAPAALMPSHGLVAAGATPAAAVMHAVLLERACRAQLDAMAAGTVTIFSDAVEARAKRDECWPASQLTAGWEYLVRQQSFSGRTEVR